ncbi:MAG: conjugal transfer protein TraF [Neisseriaceae bacterium]|nr:conjugal transfer protein TraF [Neisseriaceae bacterium]
MKKTFFALFLLAGFQVAFAEQDRPHGFLFYDDKQLPTIEPTRKKPKQPEKQVIVGGSGNQGKHQAKQISVSPVVSVSPMQKPAVEPFSVAWLRAKMPILLDNAMNNPTEENVRAYKYAERLMMDMVSNYADMSQRVVQNDPMLDESVRFPASALARSSALSQVSQAKEAIIRDLATKSGLWFFFDSKCHFCGSQYQVMKLMEEKYGIKVQYISTDGGILEGMPRNRVVIDKNGVAGALGIKVLPAVILAVPPETTAIVSHGASALSDLEEKTVTAAIDLKLTPQHLTDVAELRKRGIIRPEDIQQAKQQMQDTDDPNELVRVINQAIQKRM